MENFEKSDIITDVAFNKSKKHFLPRNEQMRINTILKNNLLRFLSEVQSQPQRPETMKMFDAMMNDMHGQRVKDLYNYRNNGMHVVAMLDSNIPHELIYGINGFIPVGICMGAGEVEEYVEDIADGLSTPVKSMIGFLKTGMCVFFNLADFVVGTNLCPDIVKASEIIEKSSSDFNVFNIKYQKHNESVTVDLNDLLIWINKVSGNKGLDRERFSEYCMLYSEIRNQYHKISELRALPNPPIDGRNSMWTQQIFSVQEPVTLLKALKNLYSELLQHVKDGIGYNPEGKRKRVLLICPRIMPPFTEIYRLIELSGGLIVHELTDMGIYNIKYQADSLIELVDDEISWPVAAVKYLVEQIDCNQASSFRCFDKDAIAKAISDYSIEAVICFNFDGCNEMDEKISGISNYLVDNKIPKLILRSDYMRIFSNSSDYRQKISDFLS